MKKLYIIFLLFSIMMLPSVSSAFDLSLGNKALGTGVVAPKGFNAITEFHYHYGHRTDKDGNFLKDIDGKKLYQQLFVVDEVLEWNTGLEVLGAKWSLDMVIPVLMINGNNPDGTKFKGSGLMDFYFEPIILGWSTPYVDSKFVLGMNLPIGSSEVSFDHFSTSFTGAVTVFFNKDRTIQLSLMPAVEVYAKNLSSEKTEGSDFVFKWGLGYSFLDVHTLGLIGYSAVKIQDDKGVSNAIKAGEQHINAVGLQYNAFIKPINSALSILVNYEFAGANMPVGVVTHLVFVKMF